MGKTKIVKTVYNDNKHNVFNEETGEVEDCAKQRRITVEEFVESDDDAEAEDSELFMANITYIKLFRGDGVAMNEKLTLKEIGKVLEISESRVSQIHSKAIIKLRSKLMTSFGDYGDIF